MVEDGHGVSALVDVLRLRFPNRFFLDASASNLTLAEIEQHRDLAARPETVTVLPRSRRSSFDAATMTVELTSPTWDDIFEAAFGHRGLRITNSPMLERTPVSTSRRRAPTSHVVPLRLAEAALRDYQRQLTEPALLRTEPPAPGATDLVLPEQLPELSAVQQRLLTPVYAEPGTWAIVVDGGAGLSHAVATTLAARTGGRLLLGTRPVLSHALRIWADLLASDDDAWPMGLEPSEHARSPWIVALDVSKPAGDPVATSALLAIIRRVKALEPDRPWLLCGTERAVVGVAGIVAETIPRIFVPDWPATAEPPAAHVASGPAVARRRRLPETASLGDEDVRAAWLDEPSHLEVRLGLLDINSYVELPVGHGLTTAARALMAMRRETDREQAFWSIGEFVRHGPSAARELEAAGFATTPVTADPAPTEIAAPFLRTVEPLADSERLARAEEASRFLLGAPETPSLEEYGDAVLYVDLSTTRYGRVPSAGAGWNAPERLTTAYRDLARAVLDLVARRTEQTFLFLPRGVAGDVIDLPAQDWQPVVLTAVDGTQLEKIAEHHDVPLPVVPPRNITCSLATAEAMLRSATG